MKRTFSLLVAAAFFPFAAAHGSVAAIIVGGQSYDGPFPATTPGSSATRMIASIDPVKSVNATTSDIVCGNGASPSASGVISVQAGDALQVQWRSGAEGTPWPHNMGPLMFYMAKCDGDAPDCNGEDVEWFKTDQWGQSDPTDGTQWFQARVMAGEVINTTIPAQIAPGNYLLRHEILALHNGMIAGAAEFYPSCTQLVVTGGQGQAPPADALVKFPGAYSATDPGILVDVYTNLTYGSYVFPGPPVAFPSAAAGNATTEGAPPAKPTKAPAPKKGKKPGRCKVKPQPKKTSAPPAMASTTAAPQKRAAAEHRRAVSRVMRRLAPHSAGLA